jgi:hypothetical protein
MFAAWQSAWAANVVFNVTVPTPTYQVWMVGNFQGWDPTKMVQMTKVDATHYTLTLDDATFASGITKENMEYKYASGNDANYAYIEKNADGSELAANRKYADSNGNDVVKSWALVYNPAVQPLPKNVTIDVLTPAGTIECYIVGNFNNWFGPTAPADSIKMKKIKTNPDGTIVFEKTIYTPDANLLAYHFCSGPAWSFEQTPVVDYHYPEVNPIVTAWKLIYDPSKVGDIHITATVPAGTDSVWIQGDYLGWDMTKAVKGVKNPDGTFSFTAPLVQAIEYRLYNKPDWGFPEVDETGAQRANRTASFPADANISITVINWLIPTAISEVREASNIIYTRNSSIVVEGVTSKVDVFDITGRILQTKKIVGTFISKSLHSGIYIVRVDGATKKVAIK